VGGASKLPEGFVFAQSPGPGNRIARQATVVLDVSTRVRVNVPNVTGLGSAAAVSRLKAVGLEAKLDRVRALVAAGKVVRQRPAAAAQAPKGSIVVLSVSRGAAIVPNLVEDTVSTAREQLASAGLVPDVFQVPSADPKGRVTAQKPAGGLRVPKGSHVRLNVSKGGGGTTTSATTTTTATTTAPSRQVAVPSLVGLGQTEAQRRLLAAHLRARVVYVASSKPANQVVGQQPSAGVKVSTGTRIKLSVSSGPSAGAPTPVPDVTGEDQQTAKSDLTQAGFTVVVLREATKDPSSVGFVIDEQPAAGAKAPAGAQLTIYVGKTP
jgi:serine/threonine-protein kinase